MCSYIITDYSGKIKSFLKKNKKNFSEEGGGILKRRFCPVFWR